MMPPRVLVPRTEEQATRLAACLLAIGLQPVVVPTIAIHRTTDASDERGPDLRHFSWVVVTSANAARVLIDASGPATMVAPGAPRWAVIGETTRAAVEGAGLTVAFQPAEASSAALAMGFPLPSGGPILVARGDLAGGGLAAVLRARGAMVEDRVVYRTEEAPEASARLLLAASAAPGLQLIAFTSGSTVRGLVGLAQAVGVAATAVPAVCIGPRTAAVARDHGFSVRAQAASADADALARAAANVLASMAGSA